MKVKFETSGLGLSKWYEYVIRFVFGGTITVLTGIVAERYGVPASPTRIPVTTGHFGSQDSSSSFFFTLASARSGGRAAASGRRRHRPAMLS